MNAGDAKPGCPFCSPVGDRLAFENELVRVVRDLYPVTEGHLLVVPRRHVARWSEATSEERLALLAEVDHARTLALASDSTIEGFNIGWNDGPAAGQTVMHLHVHVIPRRRGDVDDPRGGIRWVIPGKARYWND
jgi:diadenosine tetraphosphate (Ap4A) HIT family hydrolase